MAEPNFKNRTLYHHDNLAVLRGMNSNSVHLIATDPPFNKSKDFHATPDSLAAGARFQDRWSWRKDIHDEWLIEIQRDHPDVWSVITTAKQVYGDDMAAFLCWLGVRLLEMHRVLREDGSIYLHIDHTAHAYVKTLMDAIFGKANFRNEIVWDYTFRLMDLPRFFNRKHDTLLFYGKSQDTKFSMPKTEWSREEIIKTRKQKIHVDEQGDEWIWMPGGRGNSKSRLKRITEIMKEGKSISDVWSIPIISSSAKERTGYPTQKPLELYERIIRASSNEGDIVLDPFAGCATTPIAAERLGRQWVGIDIWKEAHGTVLKRMRAEGMIVGGTEPQEGQQLLEPKDILYCTEPPTRSDNGEPAVLVLQMQRGRKRYPLPRSQHGGLIIDIGAYCQGCGRDYGFDPRVLEVDHVRPKADGGSDAYDNLTLLCPPCNREKRDRLTLTGLQQFNRKEGHLIPENERNIRHGRGS